MTGQQPEPHGHYDQGTALLVVDVQNDFAHPDGSLYVEGGVDLLDQVNTEIAAARAAGGLVVYTMDSHPESTPHFQQEGGPWPVHCVEGSWGWQFHPDLAVDAAAPVVRKGIEGGDGYSGFSVRDPESGDEHATELGSILDEHDIEHVVVVGLAQDHCVKETTLDAVDKGYGTVVLTAATAPVDAEPGDGERALEEMADAGAKIV